MARDRRRLGPEEEHLWSLVKKTVAPLHPAPPRPPAPPKALADEPPPSRETATTAQAAPPVTPGSPKAKPAAPPFHPLGRRDRQKVVRGTMPIDGRIDLHGLRQDEAHARLRGFLAKAQASDWKLVLVITGKGRGSGFEALHEPERGVLRRMVPLWLALPEFRGYVLGHEEAHLAHGGAGAVYIRIKRKR